MCVRACVPLRAGGRPRHVNKNKRRSLCNERDRGREARLTLKAPAKRRFERVLEDWILHAPLSLRSFSPEESAIVLYPIPPSPNCRPRERERKEFNVRWMRLTIAERRNERRHVARSGKV